MTLTLTDPLTGAPTTTIGGGGSANVTATVRNASGGAVAGAVVTFTTNASLATITPASGTALTNASGVATVTLNAAGLGAAGAGTITASSQVGSAAVTGSIGYAVGAANVTVSTPAFGTNPLSAFGTTSVVVTVRSNGAPISGQTVTFSSSCASTGKAVLTSTATSDSSGTVTASYRDNGCGVADTVTASVSGLATSSAPLTVSAPGTGSIQYVSVSPASITLRGTGGAGRQETSLVTFKVVDAAGNPLGGKTVTFSLNTSVGGIGLSSIQAVSDPVTGQVATNVQAGTVSTPVRVTATTTGPSGTSLTTQSDQLTITTGIADQDSTSLSVSTYNIEGWAYDGVTTVLTMRLADHFNNPVPDGTAVNFTTEGGSVVGSCTTTAGACTATVTSQNPRPSDGRLTVLAYAVGEESFSDVNGSGLADKSSGELVDANATSTDMGEAFVDWDEDGSRDPNEPFIDFNGNGTFDGPDGKYNGVLCNESTNPLGGQPSSAGTCSTQKSLHVRDSKVVVFSGSDAFITLSSNPIDLGGIAGCRASQTIGLRVQDLHANEMPAGTTITVTSTNGTITGGSHTVRSSNAVVRGSNYSFTITNDSTLSNGVCTTDPTPTGLLTVTVTTPKGNVTTLTTSVTN